MHGKARKEHHYYSYGYSTSYGDVAATEAHGGQKTVSVREDWLERLVLRFFEQRIFGPMRLDKLVKQLKAHDRAERRNGKLARTRIRQQIGELDRKIKARVQALEKGIEPSSSPSESESCERRRRRWRRRSPGSVPSGRRPRMRS